MQALDPGPIKTVEPMILALDLATHLGYAVGPRGYDAPAFGSIKLGSDEQPNQYIWHAYFNFFLTMKEQYAPDAIVFESPIMPMPKRGEKFQTSFFTQRRLQTLCGMTELLAFQGNISCFETPASSWRKHFIGKGAGEKKEWFKQKAIECCTKRGWHVKNDNEADALGIWDFAGTKIRAQMDNRPNGQDKGALPKRHPA